MMLDWSDEMVGDLAPTKRTSTWNGCVARVMCRQTGVVVVVADSGALYSLSRIDD